MSVDEIRQHLHDVGALARCHAIEAMVGKVATNPEVLQEVVTAIVDPVNSTHILGTISVAHIGLKSLFGSSCESARQAAKHLLATWPLPDRDDLLWYLKSEGMSVD